MNSTDPYLEWNSALVARFFGPEHSGESVFLYANEDLIEEVAQEINSSPLQFVDAVKVGPPWVSSGGLCQRALSSLRDWRDRGLQHPPYIAYLVLFVLAAGLEGTFHAASYYPRLRFLLGEPAGSTLPSFHRMLELWDDLEQWATFEKRGEMGVFTARISGNRIHVGLPLGQMILTESERNNLPRIFLAGTLEPGSEVSDIELGHVLRTKGSGLLRSRTMALLTNKSDEEQLEALVDTVADELAAWDGATPAEGDGTSEEHYGAARLAIRLDPIAKRVSARVRIRLSQAFPDQLLLTAPEIDGRLVCGETIPGWSAALRAENEESDFDAARVDWESGTTFRDQDVGWKIALPGRRVRVLVEGSRFGLPGLVEVNRVSRNEEVYLLFHSTMWPLLEKWATEECEGFRRIEVITGLRPEWELAQIPTIQSDDSIREAFPILSLPHVLRLRLIGGIRSAPGHNYFSFAPPSLAAVGADGSEIIECDGTPLVPTDSGRCELPEDLPLEKRVTIEARRGGEVVKRLSLFLTGDPSYHVEPTKAFDKWGAVCDRSPEPAFVGAAVRPDSIEAMPYRASPLLVLGKDHRAPRIFVVGRHANEITVLGTGEPDISWKPIWMIPLGRRGQAIYCGTDLGRDDPVVDSGSGVEPSPLRRHVLWECRRKIKPPGDPTVAALWDRFVEASRHG